MKAIGFAKLRIVQGRYPLNHYKCKKAMIVSCNICGQMLNVNKNNNVKF